jgi:hypothetical protein
VKKVIQIVSLTLAIFTFAGSVGVGIFTHFCEKDGIEQSFIIPQKHHCEEEKEAIPACCQHEEKSLENDCCSDQMDFFQVDFESFQTFSELIFAPIATFNSNTFIYLAPVQVEEILVSNYANPPPQRTGKQILIQNQVFRI